MVKNVNKKPLDILAKNRKRAFNERILKALDNIHSYPDLYYDDECKYSPRSTYLIVNCSTYYLKRNQLIVHKSYCEEVKHFLNPERKIYSKSVNSIINWSNDYDISLRPCFKCFKTWDNIGDIG